MTDHPEWIDALYQDVRDSRNAMEPFRINFGKFVRQFVGYNHSDNAAEDRVPINLIKQDILSYLRILASHNPQMLISTRFPSLKWLAADMEAWGNWRLKEMDFERTLRRCTQNGLFQIGIGVVGVTTSLVLNEDSASGQYQKQRARRRTPQGH